MDNDTDNKTNPAANAARPRIGVLALQGDYDAHIKAIANVGGEGFLVREADLVQNADGLILPGGESTTIGKLMARYGLDTALSEANDAGVPIYGTCAGLILLAKTITSGEEKGGQKTLGFLHASVARNAWGRQIDSFEAEISAPEMGNGSVRGVFIRAPYITETGPNVHVLARWDDKIVMVRQNNLLATAFHPELTGDMRVHQYFLNMVSARIPAQKTT